jgi:glycerol kinase
MTFPSPSSTRAEMAFSNVRARPWITSGFVPVTESMTMSPCAGAVADGADGADVAPSAGGAGSIDAVSVACRDWSLAQAAAAIVAISRLVTHSFLMKSILALDQGTTSSRAIVFDQSGSIVAVAQKEFPQIFPKPGWVEHNPDDIWATQAGVATEALTKAGLRGSDVAAIGITNQRETAVVWDRETGRPIHNAIVWQDRRTAGICDRLRARKLDRVIRKKTGLIVDAYFSATKVQWMLENVAGARAKAKAGQLAFGTVDAWLVWNLTGGKVHVTDVSNASRTMLYDIRKGDWDDELLKIFGVPRSMLPEVKSSSEVYGHTNLLGAAIPIAGIAGDQQAALFGQACSKPGMAKNTYGTGCFMLMNTGTKPIVSRNNLLTTVAWRIGNRPTEYALEGSIFIAGAVVQWLRDGLEFFPTSAEVEALAASVSNTGGVYLVPAFAGLGAPHWDQYARGTIVGLTRGTTKAHIARAALEGIALQVMDVLHAMQADAGIKLKELRVDGGASANNLLMQLQADLLNVPVVRPKVTETTALGAAYLAGLAVGYWKSQADIAKQWQVDRQFKPAMKTPARKEITRHWERALDRARAWVEA